MFKLVLFRQSPGCNDPDPASGLPHHAALSSMVHVVALQHVCIVLPAVGCEEHRNIVGHLQVLLGMVTFISRVHSVPKMYLTTFFSTIWDSLGGWQALHGGPR
jgi:hypothetical protein